MSVRKLLLRPAGMFSNVNEVIQQLHIAEQQGYRFIIDWRDSCYLDPEHDQDPWLYYFEECFPDIDVDREHLPDLPTGRVIAYARGNIITPRFADGVRDPLLLPKCSSRRKRSSPCSRSRELRGREVSTDRGSTCRSVRTIFSIMSKGFSRNSASSAGLPS
jgi:hypothetical protein